MNGNDLSTTVVRKTIERNPWTTLAVLAAGALVIFAQGCDYFVGKAASPFTGEKLTADALQAEATQHLRDNATDRAALIGQWRGIEVALAALSDEDDAIVDDGTRAVERANADTDRKQATIKALINLGGQAIPGAGPLVATGMLSLLGVGLGADRLRVGKIANKRGRRITELENGPAV